ncbi:MAG: DNA polymerase III subunit alpha [Oceanococcaceae bacterium]
MSAAPTFVHLRLHTEYSLRDSMVRIKPLMQRVAALGQWAVGVTDADNVFALVKFYRAAMGAGVKPLIGADIVVQMADGARVSAALYCRNRNGFRNLARILTRIQLEGRDTEDRPHAHWSWVQDNSADIECLLASSDHALGVALADEDMPRAQALVAPWAEAFAGRVWLGVERLDRPREDAIVASAVALALDHDWPLLATNAVRFLAAEDFEAHEARVCIAEGERLDDPQRPRRFTPAQYLKSAEEMQAAFADLPEAISNTVVFAQRCNLEMEFGTNVLPDFPTPSGETANEYLISLSREGLAERLAHGVLHAPREEYESRLERELGVINQMGFPGYFLIVADFIRWSRENGVPVGPGRGSGAGSVVAWVLGITDLDPLQFDLLFERFLNPERVSMPDFDVDFCIEGRDRVIDYVAQKYGRDQVSQIITYGSMAAKAVVRDTGRVQGHGYGFVDGIARLIPNTLGISLSDALKESADLRNRYENEEEVTDLINTALKLEGLARNAGKHAGGVVIAPGPLTEFTPLFVDPEGNPVTQFDKDDVEAVGLVKFDFLGLKTLTVVDRAAQLVNRRRQIEGEVPVDIRRLAVDDAKVYELLASGRVTACFQIESAGMRRLVRDLRPDCFEDIISLLALFRPGPLQSGMVEDFVKRKHGEQEISYPHPSLEDILKPTYGVILYQEQVMQIAQVLSGYTLGGADLLRRAMGKKKAEVMAAERGKFVEGAEANGVDGKRAGEIFDLIEKFAGYGFNKSHSAAYAYVAYQTCWLKVHYPAEFLCASMTADLDNTEKLVPLIADCKDWHITVQPPCVNASALDFTVPAPMTIRYGLGALKGVGRGVVEHLLAERDSGGPFSSLFDLVNRCDSRRLNKRVLESLIKAGALDVFEPNRKVLLASLDLAVGWAEQQQQQRENGQIDIFGGASLEPAAQAPGLRAATPMMPADRLRFEKESLGLYLTVHPFDPWARELLPLASNRIGRIIENGAPAAERGKRVRGREIVAAGVLTDLRILGDRRAFAALDDGTGQFSLAFFDDALARFRHLLINEQPLLIYGRLTLDGYDDSFRLTPQVILDLRTLRDQHAMGLRLRPREGMRPADLAAVLRPYRDEQGVAVSVDVLNEDLRGEVVLPETWRVRLVPELLEALSRHPHVQSIRPLYARPEWNSDSIEAAA